MPAAARRSVYRMEQVLRPTVAVTDEPRVGVPVVDRLLEEPYQVAKLVQRRTLASTIPRDQWRRPLTTRFERAGLSIGPELLEEVLDFGAERPYDTMTAGRYVALTARKLKLEVVDQQCIAEGLREAREHLDEDD